MLSFQNHDEWSRNRIAVARTKRFECNINRIDNHTDKSEQKPFSDRWNATCSDKAFERCRTNASKLCASKVVQHSVTGYPSTRSTKIATLASPKGDRTNTHPPPFLIIGFIVSLAILGLILASIFYQTNLDSSSKKSRDPHLSGYTEETDVPPSPLANGETLLLVPRTDATRVESAHRTVVTEINSIGPYKTYKT